MSAPVYLDDREAARTLGLSYEVFRRTWSTLVADRVLPDPWYPPHARAPGKTSKHRRWDRVAIERLADRRRPPELRDPSAPAAAALEEAPVTTERARLEARLERIARETEHA